MAHNPPKYDRARHGPITTLWMAHMAGRPLWALCRNCGHLRSLNAWKLCTGSRSMGDVTFENAARRFICSKCSHRVVTLVPAEGLRHS